MPATATTSGGSSPWVLRGWAADTLLDTYEAERPRPSSTDVARSSDPNGSQRDVADELHVDLGGRIAHLWLREGDERISTVDLVGGALTLFTGPAAPGRSRWSIPRTGRPRCPSAAPAVAARGLGWPRRLVAVPSDARTVRSSPP